MINLFKRIDETRVSWLKRRGSIYFTLKEMLFKYPFLELFNHLLLLKAWLTDTCIIYAIGDSHTRPFIFHSPFIVRHISQATAHNLIKENSTSKSNEYLKLFLSKVNKKRDIVFLVFGEIDARVHIYLQHGKSGRTATIDSLLDVTVSRYGEVIRQIKNDGYNVCVHGITPASSKNFISDLPFLGKPDERNEISCKFNSKLKSFCQSNSVGYVDLRLIGADKMGYIAEYYRDDDVHFNTKIVPFVLKTIKIAYQGTTKF